MARDTATSTAKSTQRQSVPLATATATAACDADAAIATQAHATFTVPARRLTSTGGLVNILLYTGHLSGREPRTSHRRRPARAPASGPPRLPLMSLGFLVVVGKGPARAALLRRRSVAAGGALFVVAAVGRAAVASAASEILSEYARLDVRLEVAALLGLAAEVDALGPLPRLYAQEEEHGLDEDDAPFPADACVLEHYGVEAGNVDDGEHGDEARDDGPEEKLVAPGVDDPLGKVLLALGLHAEEGPAHVDHFPGEEECEPGEAGKRRCAGPEDDFAALRVMVVAVVANVRGSIAEAVEHKDKRRQAEGRHPQAVNNHVEQKLGRKDTLFQLGDSQSSADNRLG